MYGKDYGYANSRINNTIVRLNKSGEPVYVHSVSDNGLCYVTNIEDLDGHMESDKTFKVHLDDLNIEPVPLGYVNNNGRAIYLQRIPIRRGPGNQGLNRNNCLSTGDRLFSFPNKSLKQCIIGKYPTFKNALEESKIKTRNGGYKTIAFGRHWAICNNLLYYKNNLMVGVINEGKPELNPSYSYLAEVLSEFV